jgi:hypothetical protein
VKAVIGLVVLLESVRHPELSYRGTSSPADVERWRKAAVVMIVCRSISIVSKPHHRHGSARME